MCCVHLSLKQINQSCMLLVTAFSAGCNIYVCLTFSLQVAQSILAANNFHCGTVDQMVSLFVGKRQLYESIILLCLVAFVKSSLQAGRRMVQFLSDADS